MKTEGARLRWSARTDRGRFRPNNEDSFLALEFNAKEVFRLGRFGEQPHQATDFAFAVSDGMGGAKAGEFASRIAVEKITTLLPRAFHQSASGIQVGFQDVLTEVFHQTHQALAYLGASYDECRGMETTLSLCWFTPGWMYFGHVGDSRIYYWSARERTLKQLTQDDTHVGWLLRNGRITEWEARSHPGKHVLQKALGGGNVYVDPQVGAVGYEPGDRFLLCTDGLTEGLYGASLEDEVVRTVDTAAADRMVEASLVRSGRDNTTAMIVEVL
jgi:PPM family protein phosphatase